MGVVVDFAKFTLGFADSMGPKNLEKSGLPEAFRWWLAQHTNQAFVEVELPVSIQRDSLSCGLLSANAVSHHFPKAPLIPARQAASGRVAALIGILERHLELVSHWRK